jgi:hypothetical protein
MIHPWLVEQAQFATVANHPLGNFPSKFKVGRFGNTTAGDFLR